MDKNHAIQLLGGTVTLAAEAIGVTPSAVTQWPEVLPRRIEDRVLAALARRHLPAEVLAQTAPPVAHDTAPVIPTVDAAREAA